MVSHVSDGSSWQLRVWSISDRSSWRITVGLGFHPQFLDLLLTKKENFSLAVCFLTSVRAHTHAQTRAHTHTHTHTDVNNGFIIIVTLVMT